ncbi:putative amino acid permease, partial [Aureobasidium melanogenum]
MAGRSQTRSVVMGRWSLVLLNTFQKVKVTGASKTIVYCNSRISWRTHRVLQYEVTYVDEEVVDGPGQVRCKQSKVGTNHSRGGSFCRCPEPSVHARKRSVRNLEEGQAGEQHDEGEAVDRNTVLGSLAEEGRSATFNGHTVERAGSAVGIGVTSREDGSEKQCVDQVGESSDSHLLHGDDIGRGSSGTSTALDSSDNVDKHGVLRGANDAGSEGTTDEEDTETPVDGLECGLDVSAGALGLSRNHGDILWADNTERRGPKSSEESFESTKSALASEFLESFSVFPVAEAIGVVLRVTADHGDECEREEDENKNDFST